MSTALRVAVVDSSQPGEARRLAVKVAQNLGFDETLTGKVAIVVTEGATNLVKHGGGGEILLHTFESGGEMVLEVMALDKGRGIDDIAKSIRDGHSTAGTSGSGLGSIMRMSEWHDFYSLPGKGTAILARFWQAEPPKNKQRMAVEGFSVAVAGESVSGDDWAVDHTANGCSVFVVDGLGHGFAAAQAAQEGVRAFCDTRGCTPVERMEAIHARLRGTRGAAASLAAIDSDAETLSFVGVGNIAGAVIAGSESRSLVSMSGTLGHNVRSFRKFTYPWKPEMMLVLHSDGVSSRWDLNAYPGLARHSPALSAAVLYRDMARGNDDATVVTARQGDA